MRQRSHYEVLQVREDASPEVILAAWRALDRQFGGAEIGGGFDADHTARDPSRQALREQVARAAAVLLDPEARARYDAGQAADREQAWTGPAMDSGAAGWGKGAGDSGAAGWGKGARDSGAAGWGKGAGDSGAAGWGKGAGDSGAAGWGKGAGDSRLAARGSSQAASGGAGWTAEASRPGAAPYRRSTLAFLGLGWVVFFGILFLGFDHYLEIRENPNRNLSVVAVEQEEIFLRRNRSGHYLVPGKINGHPVSFLIDTGATQVSIPAELAESLQLRAGARSRALTANGPVEVRQTRVALLNIGPFEFRNVSAHLNPGMTGNQVLLGMSVLSHLDFEQSNNRLALRLP